MKQADAPKSKCSVVPLDLKGYCRNAALPGHTAQYSVGELESKIYDNVHHTGKVGNFQIARAHALIVKCRASGRAVAAAINLVARRDFQGAPMSATQRVEHAAGLRQGATGSKILHFTDWKAPHYETAVCNIVAVGLPHGPALQTQAQLASQAR